MTQVYQTRWLVLLAATAMCWLSPTASRAASKGSCAMGRPEARPMEQTRQKVPAILAEDNFCMEAAVEDGGSIRYSLATSGTYTACLSPHVSSRCGALA